MIKEYRNKERKGEMTGRERGGGIQGKGIHDRK